MSLNEKKLVVTTPLATEVLQELKYRTGETTTKRALLKAVDHYLECPKSSRELDRTTIKLRK
ncbi:MAG: DUF5371 family protein [Archaeoglobaceae archaeon]